MTSYTRPLISIVVPCYQESTEDNFISQILTFSQKTGLHAELIVVIDPPFGKWKEIEDQNIAGIKFIFNQKRVGRIASLKTGVDSASGDWICFLSADLATPLGELITSFNYIASDSELKFIFGERTLTKVNAISGESSQSQKFVENILTDLIKSQITGLGSDPRCSFILFRRDQIPLIQKTTCTSKFFFTEIRALARAENLQFVFHPIRWVYRKQTKSSLFTEWFRGLLETSQVIKAGRLKLNAPE